MRDAFLWIIIIDYKLVNGVRAAKLGVKPIYKSHL